MLDTMRSLAKHFVFKALMLLLVVSFGIWGIGDIFRTTSKSEVAKVNGEAIGTQTFQQALQSELEVYRSLMGGQFSEEMVAKFGIPNRVLTGMVNDRLLRQQTQELGLLVGEKAVAEYIREQKQFQDKDGRFDKEAFRRQMSAIGGGESRFVGEIRQHLSREALTGSLAVHPPAPLVTLLEATQNQKRKATLLTLTAEAMPEPATPDDKTLAAYYEQHKAEFRRAEYRTFSGITFSREDIQKTIDVSEDAIKALYAEKYGSNAKEPLAKVHDALVKEIAASEAERTLDALTVQIQDALAAGQSLEDVAAMADVKPVVLGPIDARGFAPDGAGVPALAPFSGALSNVFTLGEKDVSDLISQPGQRYVMVRVDAIEPARDQSLDAVRDKVAAAWKKEQRELAAKAKAEEIAKAVAGGTSLADAAKGVKAKIETIKPVVRSDTRTLPPQMLKALFSLAKGQSTQAQRMPDGAWAVARLDEILPFSQGKDDAEPTRQYADVLAKEMNDDLTRQYLSVLARDGNVTVNQALIDSLTTPRE